MRRPGALTLEVLEGHRARYVSPVRVYLVASVVYFVLAAASPNVITPPAPTLPRSNVSINLADPERVVARLSPEERAKLLQGVERAPWWLRPMTAIAIADPSTSSAASSRPPRTLFALVPSSRRSSRSSTGAALFAASSSRFTCTR